jgi:restriction system protein
VNIVTYVSIAAILLLSVALVVLLRKRFRRPDELDGMEGHDFEFYCADLLKQNGFTDVEVTRGSRDFGVDILAVRDGITYGIQCKAYTGPVGVGAVQEAYAGRDFYDRMVGVVMTNQYFTAPAMEAAGKLRILLWDREELLRMRGE